MSAPLAAALAASLAVLACAPPRATPVARGTRFSPSAPLKVLYVDLVAEGAADADVAPAAERMLDALVAARQADVVPARDLPEMRDEISAKAFLGDRQPKVLGQRAAEAGADVTVTGFVARISDSAWSFGLQAVDATGRRVDGQGGKVTGAADSLVSALRDAGGRLLAPLPAIEGPPTASDAARAIAARSGLFDRCYALGLRRSKTLGGRGVIEVTLGDKGAPAEVRVASASFSDARLAECLVDAVKGMRLPVLPGRTTLSVPVAWVE